MSSGEDHPVRVTTLELFFDLVFVFTITQLTSVLDARPTARGLLQAVLLLGVIWWMYGGYAWLTNAVAADRAGRRALLLGGMASFFVIALSVPRAFGDDGLAFGIAYLCVVGVHVGLFAQAASARTTRAVLGLAPYNLVAAGLVLVGGAVGGTVQYVLWAAAVALEWVTPWLIDSRGFVIGASHFVERHGLVVIIAIGESIVAIGMGAAGLPLDGGLVFISVLGLALSAALWWSYFGGDDVRAEHALAGAPVDEQPRLAVVSYGHAHLPILLGIVLIAAAEREAVAHAFDPLSWRFATAMAVGAAAFLLGDALFRRSLRIGPSGGRVVAAALALVAIPLGAEIAAAAELILLVGVLAGALIAEGRTMGA